MIIDYSEAGILKPLIAARSKCLGVRTTGQHADIDFDSSGRVVLNRKGMSVSADWRSLMPHLIPVELDDGLIGASGKGMAVFVMGQGPFEECAVAEGLELCFKPSSSNAGNVCPVASVPLSQYETDLAATCPNWVIDPS